ncbi:hypothetical protein CROQUDRAFT_98739 [Cronartium quercuum f. sp. fusiforme G11]|uniref:Uncharacterized protein n=1 Tax=Cronartium quercuum f. sp. fusiforme G11 TaxID=708437 RepID=A0A9P6NBZ6_9BASI|nr:hypothetical protein CROQUDRAFT_98739 [Cronartium quercuum f. sp. fusiforme G11]
MGFYLRIDTHGVTFIECDTMCSLEKSTSLQQNEPLFKVARLVFEQNLWRKRAEKQNQAQALRSCKQWDPCKRAERSSRSPKTRAAKFHYKNILRLLEISKPEPPLLQISFMTARISQT